MNNAANGTAGELRVMSELLFRGYNPAKSYLDNGIDLILEDGLRIQVKTATKRKIGRKYGYMFQLRKGNDKRKISLLEYCDFLICYIRDLDSYYIIPAIDLETASGISISASGRNNKYDKYLNNFNLLQGR